MAQVGPGLSDRDLIEFWSWSQEIRTAFGRWLPFPTAISLLETFDVGNNFIMLVVDFFNWKSHQHNDFAANILELSPTELFAAKSTHSLMDFEYKLYFRTSWMLITTMHNFHISTHKGKEINSIVFNKMIFNRIA